MYAVSLSKRYGIFCNNIDVVQNVSYHYLFCQDELEQDLSVYSQKNFNLCLIAKQRLQIDVAACRGCFYVGFGNQRLSEKV